MVTSRLLEAFLACPVKCHLLSKGELPAGTEYSAWAVTREESYRREGIRKLTAQVTSSGIASPEHGLWKHEAWPFAVGKTVQAQGWEAEIALIQRIFQAGTPSRFVPVRFAANNRLSAADKTMAAFEAIALAKTLGTKTGTARIVHGEKQATFSVNAAALSRTVHRKVSQVASLLSAGSSPEAVLTRHCPECGFQDGDQVNAERQKTERTRRWLTQHHQSATSPERPCAFAGSRRSGSMSAMEQGVLQQCRVNRHW